jgi:CTD small phosphatase-like protein 2
MDDSEYLLIDENSNDFCDEKINYNINFIIRNIHTIINNMRNTKNYNLFLNIFKNIVDISTEEINYFFKNKILKINKINSPFLSSELLKNNSKNNFEKVSVPYISKPSNKMYSLVISLDDTLIHFQDGSIKNNKGLAQLRPGLSEFFDAVKPYYEIIVFSCGNKKYSDLILNSVDNKNIYIDYKLNRDHCIIVKNDYVKDITKIGRDINKIIIVDSMPQNYRLNKENGIYIKSFYGDNPNDKVLYYLSKILVKIARNGGDVRDGIKKYWIEIINKISSNIFNNYY